MRRQKQEVVSHTLHPVLIKELTKEAERKDVSRSSYIEHILENRHMILEKIQW